MVLCSNVAEIYPVKKTQISAKITISFQPYQLQFHPAATATLMLAKGRGKGSRAENRDWGTNGTSLFHGN